VFHPGTFGQEFRSYHKHERRFRQPSTHGRIGVLRGRAMNYNQMKSAETGEYLELANRCLIEASRTLDREAADTLRHLAKRYFKEADRHKDD
jgi:hypothetical protein